MQNFKSTGNLAQYKTGVWFSHYSIDGKRAGAWLEEPIRLPISSAPAVADQY